MFCVTDGHVEDAAELLANVERVDSSGPRLKFGSYVEARHTALARNFGWVAVQLLNIEETGPTTGFPSLLQTSEQTFACLWALPLTEIELSFRKKGLERLIEYLEANPRDQISLSRR